MRTNGLTAQRLLFRKHLHSNHDAGRQWKNDPMSIRGLDKFRQPGRGIDLQRDGHRAIDRPILHGGCRQAMRTNDLTHQRLRFRKRLHNNHDAGREWNNNPMSIRRLDKFRKPGGGFDLQRSGCRAIDRPLLHGGCRQAMHTNGLTAQRLR